VFQQEALYTTSAERVTDINSPQVQAHSGVCNMIMRGMRDLSRIETDAEHY